MDGEDALAAAKREFLEETGIQRRLVSSLNAIKTKVGEDRIYVGG